MFSSMFWVRPEGEIARADEGDGADDGDARMGDVGLGVKLSFRVNAALYFAANEGSDDGFGASEEVVFLFFVFGAGVEGFGDPGLEAFK